MNRINYLSLQDVIGFYGELMGCSDEDAANQIRKPEGQAGLVSALERPKHYVAYGGDLATAAAALVHGIAEGQCFVEGNKRTALVALMSFLHRNGYRLRASRPERFEWILRLSPEYPPEERWGVEQLADALRTAMVPRYRLTEGS